MARSIVAAAGRLKARVAHFLAVDVIAQVAATLGLEWKKTPLALPQLVALFARQILAGNISMPELARRAGSQFTPEAFCIARARLPLELLQELLRRVCLLAPRPGQAPGGLWKGHRLWHIDGSSFSMPDTPALRKRFGQPKPQKEGCGFPVAHLLCLFEAATGLVRQVIVAPLFTHDLAHAPQLHEYISAGDVLIGDRAFESFAHLALLVARGVQAILPAHQKRKVDFKRKTRRGRKGRLERQRLARLGPCDQIVRWRKPAQRPAWMSPRDFAALPEYLDVREIRRDVTLPSGRRKSLVVITTLRDASKYPAAELVAVLQDRWQVEVNLRHLKTTMHMEILRSQSVAGIEKELWMFLVVYNLVRLIMLEAAAAQAVAPGRVSFADALYWVRHGDLSLPLPRLALVPLRPHRVEPRVRKRRPTVYSYMTRPRQELRRKLYQGR